MKMLVSKAAKSWNSAGGVDLSQRTSLTFAVIIEERNEKIERIWSVLIPV